MPRPRVPSINKDVLTLLLTLFLSVLLLFTRTTPQIRQLKFQLSQLANTIAYPVTWYKEVFIIREKNKLLKEQHKLGIGERTAENIKCTVGSAVRSNGAIIAVKGQDLITGIPKTMEVSSDEIRQALAETVFQITSAIKNALDKTPPEHSSDIFDFGIILTGGGALLKDLDLHIRNKTNLPVNVSEDPLLSVVKGTGIVLENLKKYRDVLIQP